MTSELKNENAETTIALALADTQSVFDKFSVTYSNYGHEHISSRPDEPFAATVGVYVFLLEANGARESITLYSDADHKASAPAFWKGYSITLIDSSTDQQQVWLKIARTKQQ